ncbi:hypothetical protein OAJ95_00320 [Pelagibacteraceae bacterium]|nr:hypothetical protein [Pelagibacteraceae bacterium]
MFIKLIFITFFVFSFNLKASEVTIIELHKNKSLDQLVLETESNIEDNNLEENSDNKDSGNQGIEVLSTAEEINSENTQNESEETKTLENNNSLENENSELVTLINTENIFDVDEKIIQNHLVKIYEIKSRTLSKEFVKILSNSKSENQEEYNNNSYLIIKKLYEIGEIQKAYSFIKEINLDLASKDHLTFFQVIELNYLLSTFKLPEVCELKNILLEKSIVLPNFLLEKTDIFCLTLENKFAEAKLLNSLLKDSEKSTDLTFQNLFQFMILENTKDLNLNSINLIELKDLIFLYSAMMRINELPLKEDFINIDPLNLAIPVILSDSTPINIRIKAANKSFFDEVISVDSLAALYQSVDFNSEQFSSPKQTILDLNKDNELVMAFYYQLANMQIFPADRLKVILEYWKFSKNIGLEKIAYSITKNILESFTPSSENSKYSIQIALAHISNQNYEDASKWINILDNSEVNKSQVQYVKFLINLYESDDLNTIKDFLNSINNNFDSNTNNKSLETIDILSKFLDIENDLISNYSYTIILDDRTMPSYFLIRDIKENMISQKNLTLFLLSIISMNNKSWNELHPEHLNLILEAYSIYDQGSLIKPIVLEILNDLNILQ